MKIRNYLTYGLVATLVLTSCNNDKKNEDPFAAPFEEKSIEDHKASIESTGLELISEMEKLNSIEAIDVMMNIEVLPEMDIDFDVIEPIKILASIGNKEAKADDVFEALKAANTTAPGLMDAWNMVTGTYSYNPATYSWDFKKGGDAIVLEFPGYDGDKSNTAQIKAYNFAVMDITDKYEIGATEIPTSLDISLKYKDNTLASFEYSGAYESDGMPTMFKSVLNVEDFMFKAELNHNLFTKINLKYTFKHGDLLIAETFYEFNGDWSEENIELHTGEDTLLMVENIVTDCNFYFEVLSLKLAGKIDYKTFFEEYMEVSTDYENDLEKVLQKYADVVNKNSTMVLVNTDAMKKIADVEAFVYKDDYGHINLSYRMIFADGSKMTFDEFTETGFGRLEKEIADFVRIIEAAYEAY
ncbi:MAG: hypothetical protein MI922_09265 [Bacteroidales bacterium]|nr:hypothetical protein [Bacteroidales bacterium]